MGALFAYPALLTTTSRLPKAVTAVLTAASAAAASVTSSATAWIRSPLAATRSSSCSGRRAVATNWSPTPSTASASARPNPRDAPVISHVFAIAVLRPSAADDHLGKGVQRRQAERSH